ncbi:pyridoxal phosphate-dependent transferase [Lineolata rhizophorae]|uniref:Pyridoxal phosphate-dependent transferase n=1 Tax=Lineolata rhizophorae TaxID=578093 RepID=A0A6A6P9W4_9PEZI|nr:pyridoxal phosphate-dependent transferase [Lineolata rhizophorae]
MASESTLAGRGVELASGPSMRDTFGKIMTDIYDPDRNPNGIVNIGTAENYEMLTEVADRFRDGIRYHSGEFNYGEGPWGSRRLRTAMAKFMERNLKSIHPIDPEKILFASGCTAIFEMLGFALADPGEGLLVSRPCYAAFQDDFELKAKMKCVFVSFGDIDQFSPAAVDCYEKALIEAHRNGTKVRALMLCNPHNPLGRCYPRETIIGLMKLCAKYSVHLLSDEIYALSVFPVDESNGKTEAFESVLSFDTTPYLDSNYLHAVYGMSKDLASGGLRMGCIYTQNDALMRALCAMSKFHWSGTADERLATEMLEDETWLEQFNRTSRARLARSSKVAREALHRAGVAYSKGSNAGFFLWIDLRPWLPKVKGGDKWASEMALWEQLMQNKVFMTPGRGQQAEEPGYFRLIFSQPEHVIKVGMQRVKKTLDQIEKKKRESKI